MQREEVRGIAVLDHIADSGKKVEQTDESAQNVQNEDLIQRKAAIDAVGSMLRRKFGVGGNLAESTINDLPPAQPEIIRCKDCKWCEDADGLMCKNTASWVVATDCDFGCVCAERRTDGWHNQQTGRD